jgi:hypothetical protein
MAAGSAVAGIIALKLGCSLLLQLKIDERISLGPSKWKDIPTAGKGETKLLAHPTALLFVTEICKSS